MFTSDVIKARNMHAERLRRELSQIFTRYRFFRINGKKGNVILELPLAAITAFYQVLNLSSHCNTCSQKRQSTKFQNHENINFVEKLYFFILYNQVYIAKHDVKSLHSGFIFRENTSHYKVGG